MGLLAPFAAVSAATSRFCRPVLHRRFFAASAPTKPQQPRGGRCCSAASSSWNRAVTAARRGRWRRPRAVHLLGPDGGQQPVAVAGGGGLVAPGSRLVGVGATRWWWRSRRACGGSCARRAARRPETASAATSTGRARPHFGRAAVARHGAGLAAPPRWASQCSTSREASRSWPSPPRAPTPSPPPPRRRSATPRGHLNHLGVGGVIDSNITSLAFFAGSSGSSNLAIGTRRATRPRLGRHRGAILRPAGYPSPGSPPTRRPTRPSGSGRLRALSSCRRPLRARPSERTRSGDTTTAIAGLSSPEMVSVVTALAEVRITRARQPSPSRPRRAWRRSICRRRLSSPGRALRALVSPQHDRYGWVAQVPLAPLGTASYVLTDGDNDGSSTSYYMASQIFRWLVTKSPEALANAGVHSARWSFCTTSPGRSPSRASSPAPSLRRAAPGPERRRASARRGLGR